MPSTVQEGDGGTLVNDLQQLLCNFGYLAPNYVDGDFAATTSDAVEKFQSDYNIAPVDGIVGPITWSHLEEYTVQMFGPDYFLPNVNGSDVSSEPGPDASEDPYLFDPEPEPAPVEKVQLTIDDHQVWTDGGDTVHEDHRAYTGEAVHYWVAVGNPSAVETPPVRAALYVDDSVVDERELGVLAAGEWAEVYLDWTPESTSLSATTVWLSLDDVSGGWEGSGLDVEVEVLLAREDAPSDEPYPVEPEPGRPADPAPEDVVGGDQWDDGETIKDPEVPLGKLSLAVDDHRVWTEGGGVVHEDHQAFASELVHYWVAVRNPTDADSPPVRALLYVDGTIVAERDLGVVAGQEWAEVSFDWNPPSTGPKSTTVWFSLDDPLEAWDSSGVDVEMEVLPSRNPMSIEEDGDLGPDWLVGDVFLTVHDWRGERIEGQAYVELSGSGGERAYGAGLIDGRVNLSQVNVPRAGVLSLTVSVDGEQPYAELTGDAQFRPDDEGTFLCSFTQNKRIEEVTNGTEEAIALELNGKLGGEWESKMWEIEAEIGGSRTRTTTETESRTIEIWIPTSTLQPGDGTSPPRER